MKDKLIIIATIQYTLEQMKLLLGDPQSERSSKKMGALTAFSCILIQLHMAITGHHWEKSPKELMEWMIGYMKQQADSLGGHAPKIRVSSN
jgi:hypothetical protein